MAQANPAKYPVDETPWLVKGIKEWLWIFANTDFGLFHAADTRSGAELDAMLGSSYEGVPGGTHLIEHCSPVVSIF